MNSADLVGQTLDNKYKIERELGRGGMGTVYLATHLGTERPVAVKVIAPQYMERAEFVERFRREARAAGRLRHPNVVNVTDFGFAETDAGRSAYLVMEYLDGCTLGEILEEEHNLPVAWTLDILEQVCSAVHAAHEQGIIHRDLKPDNIWLEPNQRGGYTVKVLDFGIAKLEENRPSGDGDPIDISVAPNPTKFVGGKTTLADIQVETTMQESIAPTKIFEAQTIAQSPDSEARTAIMNVAPLNDSDAVGTHPVTEDRDSNSLGNRPAGLTTSELTRVGAVIGTPLYMSPEQCRGERLDARSDIYSLGIIGYQMLAGRTPFEGDFTYVMEAHKSLPPPPLAAKKVRKKLERVIGTALAKNPDDRPQTAEAFASQLRSRSEGIFGLLRRAGMIYTEHMPKFLMLSTFFHIPMIFFTITLVILTMLRASDAMPLMTVNILMGINGALLWIATTFGAYLIIGTISWVVTQNLAVPLRPIRLRPALKEARTKWKTFIGTGLLSTVLALLIAIPTCGIGFFVTSVLWMLLAPVVMMENKRGMQAIKRSQQLVRRSLATSVAAFVIMFMIPAVIAGSISFVVNITARALDKDSSRVQIVDRNAAQPAPAAEQNESGETPPRDDDTVTFGIGNNRSIRINTDQPKDMRTRLKDAALESFLQIMLLPTQILVYSFTAIIVALLYLKTRQAAGEPLQDLLEKFEESEHPRKKWQERVRQRLIQSGRITSRPSNERDIP